jgi:hypothetical protein
VRARAVRKIVLVALLAAGGAARAQQDLGHKVLGSLGLDAGELKPTGLYAVDAVGAYRADELIDRNGRRVPIALNATAFVNVFGVAGTYDIPRLHTSIGAAVTAPVARVALSTDDVRASFDDFGFGDLYVQPIALGWRPGRHEIVAAYAFYAPTGHLAPGGLDGVGNGHWTHEFSAGGTLYFDRARRWKLSALASYELNERKIDVDVKRGDTIQIQGGAGVRLARILDVGLAGYALWQVTDDTGSALPPILAGARDVDYGLGPELNVTVPQLRCKLVARYTHDVYVRSRPSGSLFVIALDISAWSAH